MPNHNAAVPSPELVDKEVKVLELRRAGLTWQRIAEETGYADHTGAYAAYKRAIKRTQQQPADELREQELDRIDRLQLALWPKAMKGDNASINTIVRLMERRARLLGLDTAIKIQQDITTWTGDDSIDRAVRDLAALLTANDADSTGASDVVEHQGESEPVAAGHELEELVDSLGARVGQDPDRLGMDSLERPTTTQD
jgi:orotate phosphoribosyltransferase-like protein